MENNSQTTKRMKIRPKPGVSGKRYGIHVACLRGLLCDVKLPSRQYGATGHQVLESQISKSALKLFHSHSSHNSNTMQQIHQRDSLGSFLSLSAEHQNETRNMPSADTVTFHSLHF